MSWAWPEGHQLLGVRHHIPDVTPDVMINFCVVYLLIWYYKGFYTSSNPPTKKETDYMCSISGVATEWCFLDCMKNDLDSHNVML